MQPMCTRVNQKPNQNHLALTLQHNKNRLCMQYCFSYPLFFSPHFTSRQSKSAGHVTHIPSFIILLRMCLFSGSYSMQITHQFAYTLHVCFTSCIWADPFQNLIAYVLREPYRDGYRDYFALCLSLISVFSLPPANYTVAKTPKSTQKELCLP